MSSAIAIITYNRAHALREMMRGINEHCAQYPTAVFDDLSNADGTEKYLRSGFSLHRRRPDLLADELICHGQSVRHFLGTQNLGVTGNSNRALRWLMEETNAEHFIICNDDLHVDGDFVRFYGEAHANLQVGMFCFCDFTHHPSYRWVDTCSRGYRIKLCPRMTGIMISVHRKVVERIGYFDSDFGKFGEEHCDWTNRARLAGAISLNGVMQTQIDLYHNLVDQPERVLLRHQDVETSIKGSERKKADAEASRVMTSACESYRYRDIYRPYRLYTPRYVGATRDAGLPFPQLLSTYSHVTDFTPCAL